MKKIFLIFICFLFFVETSLAEIAVQRTTESSYTDFIKYINKSGHIPFSQAYIQISSVTEMETPLLEKCLEEMYLGDPSHATCLSAVKALSSRPLNPARREMLFSFLLKMSKIKSPNRSFYDGLCNGLMKTNPDLAVTFHTSPQEIKETAVPVKDLEMKAWKKALAKKFPLDEVSLLINGKKISKLQEWTAPPGIYQWVLVSNTHEPFVLLSTFSQFASESLAHLKPLALGSCQDLEKLEAQKFGLLRLEVFADSKCINQFGITSASNTLAPAAEHLGSSAQRVQIENSSSRHWVWPVIAILGAGLAMSLRNKNVQVQWPGSH
jgi:hypothetical protein